MATDAEALELLTPICEWCGQEINDATQPCPALDDGRCRP